MSEATPHTARHLLASLGTGNQYDAPKPSMPKAKPGVGLSVLLSLLIAVAGAATTYGMIQQKVHDTESRQLLLETSQNEMRKNLAETSLLLARIDERIGYIQEALRRSPR